MEELSDPERANGSLSVPTKSVSVMRLVNRSPRGTRHDTAGRIKRQGNAKCEIVASCTIFVPEDTEEKLMCLVCKQQGRPEREANDSVREPKELQSADKLRGQRHDSGAGIRLNFM